MININHKKEISIGILGLGSSGKSAINFFQNYNYKIYAFDNDSSLKNISNVFFQDPKLWPWRKIKELVVSPGISVSNNIHPTVKLAKKMKVPIISEVDLLARKNPEAKIIGVTGTNGKSTTTALLGHVIKGLGQSCKIGGNFGIPASSINDPGKNGYIILELSSYQLELCKEIRLDGAIILNITPDHLERHGNINSYAKAKFNINNCLKENAPLVVNADDDNCRFFLKKFIQDSGNIFYFSNKIDYSKQINSEIKINNQNISSLIVLLKNFGYKNNQIISKTISFKGLPHRLELIAQNNSTKFINDSKATNAEATKCALKNFKRIFWIAGGRAKLNGIKELRKELANVIKCYLIGESSHEFANQLKNIIPYKICFKLDEAINEVFKDIKNKENVTVLFSPAAASFDQYSNFESRGEEFKKLIFYKFHNKRSGELF